VFIKVFFQQGFLLAGRGPGYAILHTSSPTLLPATTPAAGHLTYNASTVPILQYGISSKTLSEQQTFDLALNTVRVGLISVPGRGHSLSLRWEAARCSWDLA